MKKAQHTTAGDSTVGIIPGFCQAFDEICQCSKWVECSLHCPLMCWVYSAGMMEKKGWTYKKGVASWCSRAVSDEIAKRLLSRALGEDVESVARKLRVGK